MIQDWFEMKDVRRRKLAASVWIPLRAIHTIEKHGRYGFVGFKEEFFGAGTLAVPIDKKEAASKLGWMDVGISHEHSSYVEDDVYIASDVYHSYKNDFTGIYLALEQRINKLEPREWYLHQDIVIALCLKREGDIWISPNEDYIEVARLKRDQDSNPYLLEIRAEHLRDYLCARKMALYITSYRNRHVVVEDASYINWSQNPLCENQNEDRWEGRVNEIHEGGDFFGSQWGIFHSTRTNVDVEEDVPVFGNHTDENITSRSWTKGSTGKKLYHIQGELWRNEWIEPATLSPRIRGDKIPPTNYFITDASGKRENKETLQDTVRWLWFRPDVMMKLADRRGGGLGWYTRDTGAIGCSPDNWVHFGVNRLGLVNVYAKDIALLPDWQQQIWAGFNVSPEGGVSEELLDSQAKGIPANTKAPEKFLSKVLQLLNKLGREKLGFPLFKNHTDVPKLLLQSHRFRAIDKAGLYALAKDLTRLTADRLDSAAMQKIVSPPNGVKWGSLKSLENLLASKIGTEMAGLLLRPMIGIYNLRLADAHLPSSTIEEALSYAMINQTSPPVFQGYQLLHACVSGLYEIVEVFEAWDSDSAC